MQYIIMAAICYAISKAWVDILTNDTSYKDHPGDNDYWGWPI